MSSSFIFKPIFSNNQLSNMMARFRERVDEKITVMLKLAGEEFVSHARRNGKYENRTGNLRSSIGYIVVKNGEIEEMSDFESIATNDRFAMVSFTVKSGKYQGKKVQYKALVKGGDGVEGSNEGANIAVSIAKNYPNGIVLIGIAGMEYGKYVEAMGKDVITGAAIYTEMFIKRYIKTLMNRI